MRVLIACECSGVVREEFQRRGHDAWSCDLQPADDGSPFHIQGDALAALASGSPTDGKPWDLVIAHPPCTYLCNSSVHLLRRTVPKGKGLVGRQRRDAMEKACWFFKQFLNARIPKLCAENPIMHGDAAAIIGVKWSQMIQPFHFGDPESKGTCLWLRGLPFLQRKTTQEPDLFLAELPKPDCGYWNNQTASGNNKLGGKTAAKQRARTYSGVAEAMAEQWG